MDEELEKWKTEALALRAERDSLLNQVQAQREFIDHVRENEGMCERGMDESVGINWCWICWPDGPYPDVEGSDYDGE